MTPTSSKKTDFHFLARKEFFGSLLYDLRSFRILAFDCFSTLILEFLPQLNISEIGEVLAERLPSGQVKQRIERLFSLGVLIGKAPPLIKWIPAQTPPERVLSAPVRIYFNLTQACNLNCRHCVNPPLFKPEQELNLREIERLFAQMAGLGVFELNLGGGEPFFREDLFSILLLTQKYRLAVAIATNGLLITAQKARRLAEFDNIKYIAVSLEGAKAKTNDSIRGKGSFKAALKAVSALKKFSRRHINLHFTLHKASLPELAEIFALAESSPADSLGVRELIPCGNARLNSDLILTQGEFISGVKKMHSLAKDFKKPLFIPYYFPPGANQFLYPDFGCGAAKVTCGLSAEGELLPCNFLPSYGGESLKGRSLQDAWLSGRSFLKLRNLKGNPECRSCEYYRDCRGNCRATALYFKDDINAPDEYCFRR